MMFLRPGKHILLLLALMLTALGLAACENGQFSATEPAPVYTADTVSLIQERSAARVPKGHILRPGDVVNVFVLDNPDLSRSAVVGPDGKIRYPLVGEVTAGGRSLRQLESALTAGLSRTIVAAQVSVSLAELRGYRVFVEGEVLRPGEFTAAGPLSVVQAIALAGGFTAFASRDDIIIYNPQRDGGQRIIFNYTQFIRGTQRSELFLLPGDTIIVR